MCLGEARYHRLIWSVNSISICLRHQCFLAHQCHVCRESISVEAIVAGECLNCKADLTATPVRCLPEDGLGQFAQNALGAWFDGKALLADETAYSFPPQPVPLLYQFVRVLRYWMLCNLNGQAFLNLPDQHPRIHAVETVPEVQYELTRLAVRSLVNWPTNFLKLMYELENRRELFANSPLQPWAIRPPRRPSDMWKTYWRKHGLDFVHAVSFPKGRLVTLYPSP
jgi:hypothetical protein